VAQVQAIGQDTSRHLPISIALTKNTTETTISSKTKSSRNIYKPGKPSKHFSKKKPLQIRRFAGASIRTTHSREFGVINSRDENHKYKKLPPYCQRKGVNQKLPRVTSCAIETKYS